MIGLSASSLGIFKECPRCFWLSKNEKLERPRGIKASLPSGMDKMMKAFVDECVAREHQVPWLSEIPGAVPFKDRQLLKKWMNWRTFQVEIMGTDVVVWGNLDDVIEHETRLLSPWDYKTKATEPDEAYGKQYYQDQLDIYHLLIEGQGWKCDGNGYLSYGWPQRISIDGTMGWGWKNLHLQTDPASAVRLAIQAGECLKGPEPESAIDCEYCAYVANRGSRTGITDPAKRTETGEIQAIPPASGHDTHATPKKALKTKGKK